MRKMIMFAVVCACAFANSVLGENQSTTNKDLMSVAAWNLRKGSDPAGIAAAKENDEAKLILTPCGKYFSTRTSEIPITDKLRRDGKRISFKAKNHGVNAYFAVLLEFIGANGVILNKVVLYSASPKHKPSDWRKVYKTIAEKGDIKIPAKAAAISVRMAFSPNKGVCEGKIEVANMKLENPPPEEWPNQFTVECGDLKVSFNAKTFWAISRIDYKENQVGTEKMGYYGTVAMFKDIGFIGSGHTENESEVLIAKKLMIDDKLVETPGDLTKCSKVELHTTSRVRSIELTTIITIAKGRIIESVSLRALKPEKLDLIYHFMHPWVLDFSDYIGKTEKGEIVTGKFVDNKGFHLNKAVKWSGVYSEKLGIGEVTYLAEFPKEFKFIVKYWDNPNNNYRKHYFQTIRKRELKPGTTYNYKAILGFYDATPGDWKKTAAKLAKKLGEK